ncbi:MAG TPA: hypothetical protein PK629_02655 [Oscillospiraceae bacterium]|nr:hypothetical protein [Oscillospiraceae bacterium]HPK34226.1 hypothetical protein [Oscillospiraceae bacterium]HPR74871.1 hypothetical protein [Oscillospiraceae bacterium]
MKKLRQLFQISAPVMAFLLMISFSGINISAMKLSSDTEATVSLSESEESNASTSYSDFSLTLSWDDPIELLLK